jgi:hypothetical protein
MAPQPPLQMQSSPPVTPPYNQQQMDVDQFPDGMDFAADVDDQQPGFSGSATYQQPKWQQPKTLHDQYVEQKAEEIIKVKIYSIAHIHHCNIVL